MAGRGDGDWSVPRIEDREPGVLYMNPTYSLEVYEGAWCIEVYGVRFYREDWDFSYNVVNGVVVGCEVDGMRFVKAAPHEESCEVVD